MRLDNGRRADILALRPDGGFACIEIKSDARDFNTDRKWHHYRDFADTLTFAVDADFPHILLPEDTGLIVVADTADLIRNPTPHPISPARRKTLTRDFARLAATRLATLQDPIGLTLLQTALRSE